MCFTFRDMTFCTDKKCLRTVCHRHPSRLKDNIDDLPVAMSPFKTCQQRIRSKSEPYEEDLAYEYEGCN